MTRTAAIILAVAALLCGLAAAEQRFPPPQFTDHELPSTTTPEPRYETWEYMPYVDVAVLAGAIGLSSWMALKLRRRIGVLIVMLAALAYFGFWRLGCICPIGATQNCALSIGDATYVLSLAVLALFLVPLIATLIWGRTFCGGVCPLGAVQDAVLIRPIKVPHWLAESLSVLGYLYLGTAVLLAITGSAFIICEYDPFVRLFRLVPVGKWVEQAARGESATVWYDLTGRPATLVPVGSAIAIAMFIGRPYCRFLCPYAVLLRPLSRVSKHHVTITPNECVRCDLCAEACPFGAIDTPNESQLPSDRSTGKATLAVTLALLPVLAAAGAGLGWLAGRPLSRVNYTVRAAERVTGEQLAGAEVRSDEAEAFARSGESVESLIARAEAKIDAFLLGGAILGGLVGLGIGGKLVAASVRRTRTEYTANRSLCVSCGRCFAACPVEQKRRREKRGGPHAVRDHWAE